jgi:hypothetical protein
MRLCRLLDCKDGMCRSVLGAYRAARGKGRGMGNVIPLRARQDARASVDEVAQLVGDVDMAIRFDDFAEKLQRVARVLENMSIEIKNRREPPRQ